MTKAQINQMYKDLVINFPQELEAAMSEIRQENQAAAPEAEAAPETSNTPKKGWGWKRGFAVAAAACLVGLGVFNLGQQSQKQVIQEDAYSAGQTDAAVMCSVAKNDIAAIQKEFDWGGMANEQPTVSLAAGNLKLAREINRVSREAIDKGNGQKQANIEATDIVFKFCNGELSL